MSDKIKAIESKLQDVIKELNDLKTSEKNQESNATVDMSKLLEYFGVSTNLSDDKTLELLLLCAQSVVKASGAGLTTYDSIKDCLIFRAAIGDGSENLVGVEVPLDGSRHGFAFRSGETIAEKPLYDEVEKVTNQPFKNVMVAPMIVEDDGIGTISVVNKIGSDSFSPEDMAAIRMFADLASTIVRQRYRESALLSSTDNWASVLPIADEDRELLSDIQKLVSSGNPEVKSIIHALANTYK